jgi:hypothetical protein
MIPTFRPSSMPASGGRIAALGRSPEASHRVFTRGRAGENPQAAATAKFFFKPAYDAGIFV